MPFLTGREDSLAATAFSLVPPMKEVNRPHYRHLEQRAEGTDSAVRLEIFLRPANDVQLWPAKVH